MADVFLSYARASAGQAQRVAAALRGAGFSVWFDENLPAHRAYADAIQEQLDAAPAVVVLWSKEATASQWVRSEGNRARETGRLVQARLDDARLPMPFDQIQCVDLSHWRSSSDSAAWKSVVTSVAELVSTHPAPQPAASDRSKRVTGASSRRGVLIGGSAVGALAAGGFASWILTRKPEPSAQEQLLVQKGLDTLQNNDAFETTDPGSLDQAIALLTDATRVAPQSATAWGGLALAYAARKRASTDADRSGLESRGRSAARRALALDPQEVRALAALRLFDPLYRHWAAAERADREVLRDHPRQPILISIMSEMLGSVGRWDEAAELAKQMDRSNFLIPGADRRVVVNLWSAGDLQGADEAMQTAVEHWPQNPEIWRTRVVYLMYSGRPSEALRVLENSADIPPSISAHYVAIATVTAKALIGTADAPSAVRLNLAYLKTNARAMFQVAHACTMLGAATNALELFDGYYFGEGEWAGLAPAGGDQDRFTGPLFYLPMKKLWRDPRFDALVGRIGLDDYWRRSGTTPDFRRRA
jgi:hypothetical protein